ncbi:MAG: protein translocase subunit SecD [Bowdeniella nasicola]|nr:protein translocase subunit SecD [Bowdeniella nasicola]
MSTRPVRTNAPQRNSRRAAARALIALGLLVVILFTSLGVGTKISDASWAPKLALDLEGGTQLILTPKSVDGSQVTPEDINEAIGIIRQRVDASGVAEAEITRQGQENIVVSLPGQPSDATLNLVRQSALMRFRPVIEIGNPDPMTSEQLQAAIAEQTGEEDKDSGEDQTESAEDLAFRYADQDGDGKLASEPATTPNDESDPAWITEQTLYDFLTMDCTQQDNLTGGLVTDKDVPLVTCQDDGSAKFILGPVALEGTDIASAQPVPRMEGQVMTGDWEVSLEFKSDVVQRFADLTSRALSAPAPRNQFAMVLDGLVISAPRVQAAIQDGKTAITGNFDAESARALAKQLSFGSLPLNFEVQSEEQISATLGTEQLERGILAGVIGLVLVMIYMLFVYKGLSIITMASLVMAALLTYGSIAVLAWTQGYRLSLPGVAGLIVAIGVTADSFIVYFERVRDEVREGSGLRTAVDTGWSRARRTILASDAVNLLAAGVLYFLAVGGVRGFAFTLGLTTIMDLIVVFWFTHPMLVLLVRTKFFGDGHKFSGLAPEELGATPRYRGRGRVDIPAGSAHMTIAERRAAQRQAEAEQGEGAK